MKTEKYCYKFNFTCHVILAIYNFLEIDYDKHAFLADIMLAERPQNQTRSRSRS